MSGHSQGPWGYEKGVVYDANNRVVIIFQQPTPKQAEANARLIAAAPDMLEALEGLMHPCGGVIGTTKAIANAKAAIAKAKGL